MIGTAEPLADAETLQMLVHYLDELGIAERELLISSVGDEACRPTFKDQLRQWLQPRLQSLCQDCQRRYEENPLRVFDCKVEADRQLLSAAPTPLELLCTDCREHFEKLCRLLDRYGIEYKIEGRLVRGLDYYQRTVFEVISKGLGAQDAILGGGRYDGLMEELGGPAMAGFGFAIGMERMSLLLRQERIDQKRKQVALIALGPEGIEAAVLLAQRLRGAGHAVSMPLVERPLGAQLKRADRYGARFAIFIGKDEVAAGRYGFKDLESGDQVTLNEEGILARLGGADVR